MVDELERELAQADAAAAGRPEPVGNTPEVPLDPEEQKRQEAEAKRQALATTGREAIHQLLSLAVPMLAPALPNVAAVYTPQCIDQVAQVTGDLCGKYGWDLAAERWKEEIAAAAVLVPLTITTYQAARVDLAELARKGKARDGAPVEGGQQGEGEPDPEPPAGGGATTATGFSTAA